MRIFEENQDRFSAAADQQLLRILVWSTFGVPLFVATIVTFEVGLSFKRALVIFLLTAGLFGIASCITTVTLRGDFTTFRPIQQMNDGKEVPITKAYDRYTEYTDFCGRLSQCISRGPCPPNQVPRHCAPAKAPYPHAYR